MGNNNSNKIFISYKRANMDKVLVIKDEIEKRTGISCWMDLTGIVSGDNFNKKITNAINECEILLFMLSKEAIEIIDKGESWTQREIMFALRRGKRVIPISIDGTMTVDSDWLCFNCAELDSIDINKDYQKEKLFRDLCRLLGVTMQQSGTEKIETNAYELSLKLLNTNTQKLSLEFKQPIEVEKVKDYWYNAEQGDSVSQYNIGLCYYKGHQIPQNYIQSMEWFQKAAEQGDADAQFCMGSFYYDGHKAVEQDFAKAAEWFTKAAEQGEANAQLYLGESYYNGKGVPQSFEKATLWLKKAAEQGIITAQHFLGNCYDSGRGVPQDYKEAAKWFLKAAEHGYGESQCNIGNYYLKGLGVEANLEIAVKWYLKAAEQDIPNAKLNLGICYYRGLGVEQNPYEGLKWIQKAARQGFPTAQKVLLDMGETW